MPKVWRYRRTTVVLPMDAARSMLERARGVWRKGGDVDARGTSIVVFRVFDDAPPARIGEVDLHFNYPARTRATIRCLHWHPSACSEAELWDLVEELLGSQIYPRAA